MAVRAKASFGMNRLLKQIAEGDLSHLQEAARQALERAALLWQQKFLPRHFEATAPARYRPALPNPSGAYEARTRGYLRRKQVKYGHALPMVWSGAMRAAMLNQRTLRSPKRTGKETVRVTIVLPHARAMNLWRGGGRKHDFPKALTAITRPELEELHKFAGELTAQLLVAELERAGKKIQLQPVRAASA